MYEGRQEALRLDPPPQQARETRLRIIQAARELFVDRGLRSHDVAEIARVAERCCRDRVCRVRQQGDVAAPDLVTSHFRGDEEDVPLFDRAEMQAVLDEPDLATRYAGMPRSSTATNSSHGSTDGSPLRGRRSASEPAAAAMLVEFSARRLDACAQVAKAAAATGHLAVSESECRDVLFATMDGAPVAALRDRARLVRRALTPTGSDPCGSPCSSVRPGAERHLAAPPRSRSARTGLAACGGIAGSVGGVSGGMPLEDG